MAANAYCMRCVHHGNSGNLGVTCDYLLNVGKMRGCEPGEGCKRFTAGRSQSSQGGGRIDWEELVRLKKKGVSDADCARRYGVTLAAIGYAKKRLIAKGRLPAAMFKPYGKRGDTHGERLQGNV